MKKLLTVCLLIVMGCSKPDEKGGGGGAKEDPQKTLMSFVDTNWIGQSCSESNHRQVLLFRSASDSTFVLYTLVNIYHDKECNDFYRTDSTGNIDGTAKVLSIKPDYGQDGCFLLEIDHDSHGEGVTTYALLKFENKNAVRAKLYKNEIWKGKITPPPPCPGGLDGAETFLRGSP